MLKQLQFLRNILMHSYLPVWLTLVLGSLLSGGTAIFVATQEVQTLQRQFPRRVNHLALALQQRIEGSLQGTLTTGRFVQTHSQIDEAQLNHFTDSIFPQYPGLLELGWAVNRSEDEFRVIAAKQYRLQVSSQSTSELPEILDDWAIANAVQSRRSRVSRTRFDPQVRDYWFNLYYPIYDQVVSEEGDSALGEDNPKVLGVVYGTYRLKEMLRLTLGTLDIRNLDFYLFEMTVDILDSSLLKENSMAQENFLFFYDAETRTLESNWQQIPPIQMTEGDYCPVQPNHNCIRSLNVGDREWSMLIVPRLDRGQLSWRVGSTLAIGLLATGLLASYLRSLLKHHNQTERLNEHLSAELDISRRLQKMLLPTPHELQKASELEIATYMEPADEVGGDYYDILIGEKSIKIGIGDVTGHGLESGVLAIMVQTAVRTLEECQETDPRKFLDVINRTIYQNVQRMQSDKNLSLCLIDYHDGLLKLSGQHEEVIIAREEGIERVDTIDLGFPIGLDTNILEFINGQHLYLNPGDVVVLYTDGITEAENRHKQLYGIERLCQVISQHRQYTAEVILQGVIDDVRRHIGQHKVYDDITLLVIKRRPRVSPSTGEFIVAKSAVPSLR
ncbi:MAG: sigma-B regulation protein RsbU (phosphoserine phosphatase) [Phormidium sp. OSCR]|nr:MAG: sigma-B regulation protein RsbU (phosphoserine phosphatase) [Phormidium sp. OSCR]